MAANLNHIDPEGQLESKQYSFSLLYVIKIVLHVCAKQIMM